MADSNHSDDHHHHHHHHHHDHHSGQDSGFEAVSKEWDRHEFINRVTPKTLEYSQKEFGLFSRESVLDFGAGTGLAAFQALALPGVAMKRFVGVDVSEGMLAEFQKKIDAYTGPVALEARCVELKEVGQLGGQRFDAIYSQLVFHHIQDMEATVRVLYELLNPGGLLVIWDFEATPESHHFHPESRHVHRHGIEFGVLQKSMVSAGFSSAEDIRAFEIEKEGRMFTMLCSVGRK